MPAVILTAIVLLGQLSFGKPQLPPIPDPPPMTHRGVVPAHSSAATPRHMRSHTGVFENVFLRGLKNSVIKETRNTPQPCRPVASHQVQGLQSVLPPCR